MVLVVMKVFKLVSDNSWPRKCPKSPLATLEILYKGSEIK